MSHKDNQDLRNTGDGGWFYAEHELFSVFVPLIGPDGGMVYMAMCRLIPLAAVDPDRPVTVRSCSEACGVSKSTTGRKMMEIVRLGMVEEVRHSNRRPSTYKLISLKKLIRDVGIDELQRRLGVPPGDTGSETEGADQVLDRVDGAAQTAFPHGDATRATQSGVAGSAKPPAASGRSGVPPGDTEASGGKKTLVELLVSQKQASVSQKQASVSQNRGSLFKEEKEEEYLTPLPPSAKVGLLSNLHASSDGHRPDGKGKAKTPHDAKGLQAAVAKVKRECGLSGRRIGGVIETAMLQYADRTDERPDWNWIAEFMNRQYDRFLQKAELMAYKVGAMKFFTELWTDDRKWPWDEKVIRERENRRL